MKFILLTFFTLLFIFVSKAQTWSGGVAQLVYDKCTKCHHPGGIGPGSFTSYGEISPMAGAVYDAVNQDHMPPWPPDNNYQQYAHNRALSTSEKTTLLDWILAGYPEGDASQTPPPPIYSDGALLGTGDLTVKIPTYMSKATSVADDYVCFAIPSGLTQNRVIKSVEIIPGNREIVHHALIYLDPSGVESTDTSGGCASPSNATTKLIAGYTPGSTPMVLPSMDPLKLGINIAANSKIYFAMHYPSGSYGMYDSTKVIFHFYPSGTTGIRQVSADPILQNWMFNLPANQITNVAAQYPNSGTLQTNVSVLSVFPHMHLLGQSIKTYATTSAGDTVKLANLPHWDFHWQDFYFFKNIQLIPVGSRIKAEGKYDNTTNNIHNPNNPPINVGAGLNTSDEMFLVYFHYMPYVQGDENYDMEALMTASIASQLEDPNSVYIYPNPFESNLHVQLDVSLGSSFSAIIYDGLGKPVKVLARGAIADENTKLTWDATNENNELVSKGMYYLSIISNGKVSSKRIIKM